jgi:hypothetical protein
MRDEVTEENIQKSDMPLGSITLKWIFYKQVVRIGTRNGSNGTNR